MNLAETLRRVLSRYVPDNPLAPADRFVFGFVTPEREQYALSFDRHSAVLDDHVRDAQYLIYGDATLIDALLDPTTPDRAALVTRMTMRPDYPFNNYLLSILLHTFDLMIPDLDMKARRFDGPFPFPPRYPVSDNLFRQRIYQSQALPTYDPDQLPALIADDHPDWVRLHDRAWQIAFNNLRQPEAQSGFVANFIDPAFNDNVYLWDTCFMTLFGTYGRQQFAFLKSLDNFYAKQHDDGFICREINSYSGSGVYQSLDPRSTGPNIFAWTEWLHFQQHQRTDRLHKVFPVLIGYHRWCRDWRTHPDGLYWTSGWGSGMDNQSRVPHSEYHHRGYAWVDASMQAALSCEMLLNIGRVIDNDEFADELHAELDHLRGAINADLWDEVSGFYYDRAPNGSLSRTKSIGAFWGLLSSVVPPDRAARLITHLNDPATFNRPHRVPTQPADSDIYNPHGGYWLGAVWSPTNYMVLRGLNHRGDHDTAHAIALNHVENVSKVFTETGTLWENYAPEFVKQGYPAGREFVGWTGLSAISIPIEYLIGLRMDEATSTPDRVGLIWEVRLTERHGVVRYPLYGEHMADLICAARATPTEPPALTMRTTMPITIRIVCAGRSQQITLAAGDHHLLFSAE